LTKVDHADFKHELLNRLRSIMAVNVLSCRDLLASVFLPYYERPRCELCITR